MAFPQHLPLQACRQAQLFLTWKGKYFPETSSRFLGTFHWPKFVPIPISRKIIYKGDKIGTSGLHSSPFITWARLVAAQMNQDLVSITDHASIVSATAIKLTCVWFSLPHFILGSISTMDLVQLLKKFELNLMTLKVSEVSLLFSEIDEPIYCTQRIQPLASQRWINLNTRHSVTKTNNIIRHCPGDKPEFVLINKLKYTLSSVCYKQPRYSNIKKDQAKSQYSLPQKDKFLFFTKFKCQGQSFCSYSLEIYL